MMCVIMGPFPEHRQISICSKTLWGLGWVVEMRVMRGKLGKWCDRGLRNGS